MKSSSRLLAFACLAALCTSALATGPKDPPTPPAGAWSSSSARAGAAARSASDSAASADNAVDITYEGAMAPMIMGTLLPVSCGAGVQAGAQDDGDAGFFGITWTTKRCYSLKVATAWAAMGEYEMACDMFVDITREALKRRGRHINCTEVGFRLRMQHMEKEPAEPVVTMDAVKQYIDEVHRRQEVRPVGGK